ncbi:hypothetical protein BDV98DRAFT_640308 [Pterulicium gracile]|uniref:Uncharacterized protein n=1 Tax=Pterulicium gracile TaxID=1884261 RepID=A0A5C3QSB0_9AGAR|nr:hypothetical protein BDV98DRAFT_640308 [Pterula gracilis]
MPVHPNLRLDFSALKALKLMFSATTLIEIAGFLELMPDTLKELELSGVFRAPLFLDGSFRISPRSVEEVYKRPKERVALPHLRTLVLHRLTLDQWFFAAFSHYNLIRMPGLTTLHLDEIKGGLKAALAFFGTREEISPPASIKELSFWGKTARRTSEDSLAHTLRHPKGLEVLFVDRSPNKYKEHEVDYYCRDQLKFDEDDGWLEALRGRSPEDHESGSDGDQDAQSQHSDLEETICPNLRKLTLLCMEVDSRLLKDVVESRWGGGGGAL